MCVYDDGRGAGLLSPRPLPFPLRNSPNQKDEEKNIKIRRRLSNKGERAHCPGGGCHHASHASEYARARPWPIRAAPEANLYSSSNDSSRALYRNAPRVASADMCHVPLCIETCLSCLSFVDK